MKWRMKEWRGAQVVDDVDTNVAKAISEFGLVAEGHSKRELQKGHGVISGTLRRSIHTAQPGYNWAGDNVKPSSSSPERGNQVLNAIRAGQKVTIQLGSGLGYSLPVHQGHGSFGGYHFL